MIAQKLMLQSKPRGYLCAALAVLGGASGFYAYLDHLVWPALIIFPVLVWLSFIDLEKYILPDMLTYPIIMGGLIWVAFTNINSIFDHIVGAIAGYLILASLSWYYKFRTGKLGMGLGDAKLLAGAGAWLGWVALPSIMLLASVTGLARFGAIRLLSKTHFSGLAISFGPHIALGIWVVWLFGPIGGL